MAVSETGFETQTKEAAAFVAALWPDGIPDGFALYTWRSDSKLTSWWLRPELAARQAGLPNIYIGCSIGPKGLSERHRCKSDQAGGIPGVWLDIDIKGSAHKAEALPADENEAMVVCPLAPTILVHSGNGLQAWWLFEQPWIFADDRERRAAAEMVEGFQAAARQIADGRGWKLDATADLARVLRLPGTLNGKSQPPKPVSVISADGPRYTRAELESHCIATAAANGRARMPAADIGDLFAARGEGERHAAALRLAGSFISTIKDPTNNSQVALVRQSYRSWNAANNPPLPDEEADRIFNDLLRKERSKKASDDFDAAFGAYTQAPDVPAAVDAAQPFPDKGETAVKGWRLEIVDADPKIYRVYSDLWIKTAPKGRLEMASAQFVNVSMIRQLAVEQAGVWLPSDFVKAWNGTSKDKGIAARLLDEAKLIAAEPEMKRRSVVALSIIRYLTVNSDTARRHDEPPLACFESNGAPTIDESGNRYVSLDYLIRKISEQLERFNRREIFSVMKDAGAETLFVGNKQRRGRIQRLAPECFKALESIANDKEP